LSGVSSDSLVVTHPFHRLAGIRVLILHERRCRLRGHVYVCDAGSLGVFTLPDDFTDRGCDRSAGESPVDADLLSELAALVAALRKPLTKDFDR
jgi:hypothetical protein